MTFSPNANSMTVRHDGEQDDDHALTWALRYAAAGLAVLPLHTPDEHGTCSCRKQDCPSIGKHPRLLHGSRDASSDEESIRRWWGMWPDANVGALVPAGHIVLDIDPRHGGERSWAGLQARNNILPVTRTVHTGGDGRHIWLAYGGTHRGQLHEKHGPPVAGIDVKGPSSGFLVMPPSRHASGQRYRWQDVTPAETAPGWLRRLLQPPPAPARQRCRDTSSVSITPFARAVATAQPGLRNTLLFWAACRAAEHGLDLDPLKHAARDAGLDDNEIDRTARSAQRTIAGEDHQS